MPERVTVFYDYMCPFCWRAAEVFELAAGPLDLDVTWQHFSIYQLNYDLNAPGTWQLWNERLDHSDDNGCKGLLPFMASQAARQQGRKAHDAFRLELQRAVHRDYRQMNLATILDVVEGVGLQRERFNDDLANPENRTTLAQEHAKAASHDLFGTPTVVFQGSGAAYFRLSELPRSQSEAVDLVNHTKLMLERYPYLQTLRRPRAKGN